ASDPLASDEALESPLAIEPVSEDPLDAPERPPGVDAAPPEPGMEMPPKIDNTPLSTGDGQLEERHRSPSGHLRILFAKNMATPGEPSATDPED
ncbi:MAG: hypothetical protein AAF602_16245, partial [Myxococcota bacterium]